VTLLTHDSFNVSEDVLAAFTRSSGVEVEVLRGGDAGVMVNQAILSRDNPQADVLFGVDNTFLSRALDAGLFVPYESPLLADVDDRFVLDEQHRVTPVDYGDVCLNYDREAFAGGGRALPERLEDLTEPEHAGTLVVENPATSSPGLAFMLATIERFGEDGWLEYWEGLRANDVAVAAGWEDAYYGQFSGASGEGDRPLVVSYASSPPAEVYFAETPPPEPPTGVITDGCFRQIEFVGILAGTDQEAGAQALVDFMVGREFQEDLPLQMFVFPVRGDAVLPEVFVAHAVIPDDPIEMDYQRIGERREEWIEEWTAAVLR
jgi:thiamine transport system substrate-binding protein